MKIRALILIFAISVSFYAHAQVKGPEKIIGSYSGDMKKGLAHGKGTSAGKDSFEGEFKKGFSVQGTYIFGSDTVVNGLKLVKGDVYNGEFSNGLFDGKGKVIFKDKSKSAIEGYWEKGKYIGHTKSGYEILKKTNISRVIVRKNGFSPNRVLLYGLNDIVETGIIKNIEFSPKEVTDATKNIDVNVSGSSQSTPNNDLTDHTIKTYEIYNDLPESKFPFIIEIKGSVPSNNSKAELKILLEQPGYWVITVETNDYGSPK